MKPVKDYAIHNFDENFRLLQVLSSLTILQHIPCHPHGICRKRFNKFTCKMCGELVPKEIEKAFDVFHKALDIADLPI